METRFGIFEFLTVYNFYCPYFTCRVMVTCFNSSKTENKSGGGVMAK